MAPPGESVEQFMRRRDSWGDFGAAGHGLIQLWRLLPGAGQCRVFLTPNDQGEQFAAKTLAKQNIRPRPVRSSEWKGLPLLDTASKHQD